MCCLSPMKIDYPDHIECLKCGDIKYKFTPWKILTTYDKVEEGIRERPAKPYDGRRERGKHEQG